MPFYFVFNVFVIGHSKKLIESNKKTSLSAKHFYATDEHFQELERQQQAHDHPFFIFFFIITIRFSLEILPKKQKK